MELSVIRTTPIPPEGWAQLQPIFIKEFGTDEMPDAETMDVFGLFEDGRLVGLFMLERVVHMTLVIAPERRGNGLARRACEAAFEMTKGHKGYIAATKPEIEHLAESFGLTKIDGVLYRKEK